MVAQVSDDSCHGSLSITGFYYVTTNEPTVVRSTELTAMTTGGVVDCKGNSWGTFPDPTARFSLVRPEAIDFPGVVGVVITGLGPR